MSALSTSERYDGKNVAAIREPLHGDCVIRLAHPIPLGQDFPTGTRLAFGWTVAATDNVRAPPSSPITSHRALPALSFSWLPFRRGLAKIVACGDDLS